MLPVPQGIGDQLRAEASDVVDATLHTSERMVHLPPNINCTAPTNDEAAQRRPHEQGQSTNAINAAKGQSSDCESINTFFLDDLKQLGCGTARMFSGRRGLPLLHR